MTRHLGGDPIVEHVGWPVHLRRETAPVKPNRMAATLHAFDHKDVLLEHFFPLGSVARAQFGVGLGLGLVEVDVLNRALWSLGHEHNGNCVIAMNTEKDIRVGSDIFGGGVPFIAELVEIGKAFAVFAFELAVDIGALTREMARLFDVIVIL